MKEIWKDVNGYEDSHQVSNLGNVRTKDRYARVCGGSKRFVEGKMLKPVKCTNGYLEIHLCRHGKRKVVLLHRLVAEAFIPNPYGFPEVNHKDENIENCRADNLEWCTSRYNANYGARNAKCKMANRSFEKAINQYTKDGTFVKSHACIRDACREIGADASSLVRVCKGKQKTSVGYVWEYAE